jgi:BirA family transcriptional regulator, biotin operon repressor / biotin---[acetyl-CoA-carboxylase] ligase
VSYNAALLRALASGEPVSGEALGAALGTSRAAVWKAVQRLRTLGLDIEAQPGTGYRLAHPLELLDATHIRAALPAGARGRIGRLEVLAETDSTNARVLAMARPVGELAVCLAEYQSAGRGRRGRRWFAPPAGGLCLSVGGRMPLAPSDYAVLPAAVGLACAGALEAAGVPGIGLKWPNDLLLDGGKLGGILIEMRGEAQGPSTLAVGLGINFRLGARQRAEIEAEGGLLPAQLEGAIAGAVPGRNRLAAVLVAAVADCLAAAPAELNTDMLEAWRRRDALRDRRVSVDHAGEPRSGIARGLDAGGALLLETGDGDRLRITAGEASLRAAG